jgi:hypothetical protein
MFCCFNVKKSVGYVRLVRPLAILSYLSVYTVFIHDILVLERAFLYMPFYSLFFVTLSSHCGCDATHVFRNTTIYDAVHSCIRRYQLTTFLISRTGVPLLPIVNTSNINTAIHAGKHAVISQLTRKEALHRKSLLVLQYGLLYTYKAPVDLFIFITCCFPAPLSNLFI